MITRQHDQIQQINKQLLSQQAVCTCIWLLCSYKILHHCSQFRLFALWSTNTTEHFSKSAPFVKYTLHTLTIYPFTRHWAEEYNFCSVLYSCRLVPHSKNSTCIHSIILYFVTAVFYAVEMGTKTMAYEVQILMW